MQRVRSKLCGITRVEDALAAAAAGADAIGLVFYAASPRAVSIEQAASIVQALPPFVSAVGLFVDAPRTYIEQVLQQVALDCLQFHGDETPEDCRGYGRPYIRALRMHPELDVHTQALRYGDASGLLLDAYVEGVAGGTGATFDWARIPADLSLPVILAGGLTAANVAQAVMQVRPWAVDVSGGVEASKGIKDRQKIHSFMQALNTVAFG